MAFALLCGPLDGSPVLVAAALGKKGGTRDCAHEHPHSIYKRKPPGRLASITAPCMQWLAVPPRGLEPREFATAY